MAPKIRINDPAPVVVVPTASTSQPPLPATVEPSPQGGSAPATTHPRPVYTTTSPSSSSSCYSAWPHDKLRFERVLGDTPTARLMICVKVDSGGGGAGDAQLPHDAPSAATMTPNRVEVAIPNTVPPIGQGAPLVAPRYHPPPATDNANEFIVKRIQQRDNWVREQEHFNARCDHANLVKYVRMVPFPPPAPSSSSSSLNGRPSAGGVSSGVGSSSHHQHRVEFLDVVMEYVRNGDLKHHIDRWRPLTPRLKMHLSESRRRRRANGLAAAAVDLLDDADVEAARRLDALLGRGVDGEPPTGGRSTSFDSSAAAGTSSSCMMLTPPSSPLLGHQQRRQTTTFPPPPHNNKAATSAAVVEHREVLSPGVGMSTTAHVDFDGGGGPRFPPIAAAVGESSPLIVMRVPQFFAPPARDGLPHGTDDDAHALGAVEATAERNVVASHGTTRSDDRGRRHRAAFRLAIAERLEIARAVVLQALSGLHYYHSVTQRAHRDVKPGNILVSPCGRIKVADFGCSRDLTSTEQLTLEVGTPGFHRCTNVYAAAAAALRDAPLSGFLASGGGGVGAAPSAGMDSIFRERQQYQMAQCCAQDVEGMALVVREILLGGNVEDRHRGPIPFADRGAARDGRSSSGAAPGCCAAAAFESEDADGGNAFLLGRQPSELCPSAAYEGLRPAERSTADVFDLDDPFWDLLEQERQQDEQQAAPLSAVAAAAAPTAAAVPPALASGTAAAPITGVRQPQPPLKAQLRDACAFIDDLQTTAALTSGTPMPPPVSAAQAMLHPFLAPMATRTAKSTTEEMRRQLTKSLKALRSLNVAVVEVWPPADHRKLLAESETFRSALENAAHQAKQQQQRAEVPPAARTLTSAIQPFAAATVAAASPVGGPSAAPSVVMENGGGGPSAAPSTSHPMGGAASRGGDRGPTAAGGASQRKHRSDPQPSLSSSSSNGGGAWGVGGAALEDAKEVLVRSWKRLWYLRVFPAIESVKDHFTAAPM